MKLMITPGETTAKPSHFQGWEGNAGEHSQRFSFNPLCSNTHTHTHTLSLSPCPSTLLCLPTALGGCTADFSAPLAPTLAPILWDGCRLQFQPQASER